MFLDFPDQLLPTTDTLASSNIIPSISWVRFVVLLTSNCRVEMKFEELTISISRKSADIVDDLEGCLTLSQSV